MAEDAIARRQQQVLYDKKWEKLLRRAWLFRFVPFVEFVLAAGSMAIGNVRADSDFDVIIGVKSGRIFTARFFAVIGFGFFGWRRTRLNHQETAADKICLNHFITEKSYRLSPPYNDYWKDLYLNLVPVFGTPEKINKFFEANSDWLGADRNYRDDLRHYYRSSSWAKKFREWLLDGRLGDWLETILRRAQISRIEKSLRNDPPGYKPRIKYNDEELEFHPDTKRIQDFLQS